MHTSPKRGRKRLKLVAAAVIIAISAGTVSLPVVASAAPNRQPKPPKVKVVKRKHALGAESKPDVVPVHVDPGQALHSSLPASMDLSRWTVPVKNQGNVGSCVSYAITYAMLGWYARRDVHAGQPFSPMYSYAQTKVWWGEGSYPEDVLNLVKKQGASSQTVSKRSDTDYTTPVNDRERVDAANHKIEDWKAIFANVGSDSQKDDAIAAVLAGGDPVAISIDVGETFQKLGSGVYDDLDDKNRGGHAMLAVGYDDSGLLVQNSWGTDWGNKGFARIAWRVVESRVKAAWSITDGFRRPRELVRDAVGMLRSKLRIGGTPVFENQPPAGVKKLAANDGVEVAIDSNDAVWARESVDRDWTRETFDHQAVAVATANNVQMVINTRGEVWARNDIGFSGWRFQAAGPFTSVATGDGVSMAIDAGGRVWASNSLDERDWMLEPTPAFPNLFQGIAASRGQQYALDVFGNVWAKDSVGGVPWVKESGISNVRAIAADDGVQMAVDLDGNVWARTSIGADPWIKETNGTIIGIAIGRGTQMMLENNHAVWAQRGFGIGLGTRDLDGWPPFVPPPLPVLMAVA